MADVLARVAIPSSEKRRDGSGKFYVYHIVAEWTSGRVVHTWRRYSQFDALRNTMSDILGGNVPLPKLTSKKYLGRSSVQAVAEHRRPKLEKFLVALLEHSDNPVLTRTLQFFLAATAEDLARLALGLDTGSKDGGDSEDDDANGEEGGGDVADASGGDGLRVWALAVHDFVARSPEELSVSAGSSLELLEQIDCSWFKCAFSGQHGLVPVAYVQLQAKGWSPQTPLSSASGVALAKPSSPAEELKQSEDIYFGHLVSVRDTFFPRLRHFVTAGEAKKLFNNWAELVPCSQVVNRFCFCLFFPHLPVDLRARFWQVR
jgi:hypothetical protein